MIYWVEGWDQAWVRQPVQISVPGPFRALFLGSLSIFNGHPRGTVRSLPAGIQCDPEAVLVECGFAETTP